MKKFLKIASLLILMSAKLCTAQFGGASGMGGKAGSGGGTSTVITATLDGTQHGNASTGGTPASSISLTLSPTAGDGMTCEFVISDTTTFISITDSNARTYAPGVTAYDGVVNTLWKGTYFLSNVASGATIITLNYVASTVASMSCEAWKPSVAATFSLDGATVQHQDTTGANPTSGGNLTPTNPNEVVVGYVFTDDFVSSTPGASYTSIDIDSAFGTTPEYWIQTTATATNTPYTHSSQTYNDMMAAFYFH